jgi:hypothetical protein
MAPVQVHMNGSTDGSSHSSSWTWTRWSQTSVTAAVAASDMNARHVHAHELPDVDVHVPTVLWPRTSSIQSSTVATASNTATLQDVDWTDTLTEFSARDNNYNGTTRSTAASAISVSASAIINDPSSSWEEEAFWMSFRNAVHYVAQLKQQQPALLEVVSITGAATATATTTRPPARITTNNNHHVSSRNVDNSSNNISNNDEDEDDDSLARFATQHLQNNQSLTTANSSSSNSSTRSTRSQASLSLLASDLAETKMRLALAEAERDEMEFALLATTSGANNL